MYVCSTYIMGAPIKMFILYWRRRPTRLSQYAVAELKYIDAKMMRRYMLIVIHNTYVMPLFLFLVVIQRIVSFFRINIMDTILNLQLAYRKSIDSGTFNMCQLIRTEMYLPDIEHKFCITK